MNEIPFISKTLDINSICKSLSLSHAHIDACVHTRPHRVYGKEYATSVSEYIYTHTLSYCIIENAHE